MQNTPAVKPDQPDVSIIILLFNGMSHLPDLMESIDRQTKTGSELIVVDNHSSDGSAEWVARHYPNSRLIRMPSNRGFCAGMNIGAQMATGRFILLLNQDLVLDPDAVRCLTRTMKESPGHIIGAFPKVLFKDAPHFINAFGVSWYEQCHWRDTRVGLCDLNLPDKPVEVFGSIFPAVMFRRDQYFEIGALDETFWSYDEDFDICYRANVFGYRFITVPDSRIWHKYRASSLDRTDPLQSRYWFIRNYFLVFLKNYSLKNLLKYRRIIFMRYLGHAMRSAVRNRQWPEIRMYLRIAAALLLLIPHILIKRHGIQSHRKKQDEQIWTYGSVEEFNLYHVDGCIVLSLKSLHAAACSEQYEYESGGRRYTAL